MSLKVFQINIDGEYAWMCDYTNIGALKKHAEMTDLCLIDFDSSDEVVEVPKEKWPELKIIDIDADKVDGEYPYITFEEYMKDAVSRDMIATSVY